MYRVMLHNDNTNRREYVVKVLMKIVEGLTVDDAVNVMNVSICSSVASTGLGPPWILLPISYCKFLQTCIT